MDVHVKKSILMQRLMDAVGRGYVYHTSGTVSLEKAENLCHKFDHKYGIFANNNQRYYAKKQGRANVRLYLYHMSDSSQLYWWLLATKGQNEVHNQENLQIAYQRNGRIRVPGEYELLPLTRPKSSGGGSSWTWKMTKETYSIWREKMISIGRNQSNLSARQALGSLEKAPGFRGVRQQIGKLSSILRKSWVRHHGDQKGFPGIMKLNYIERVSDETIELHALIKLQKKAKLGTVS